MDDAAAFGNPGDAAPPRTRRRPRRMLREAALELLAQSMMTQREVAARVGVSERHLSVWINHDAGFRAELAEARERHRASVRAAGVALAENRIAEYDRRWRALREVMERRGEAMRDVPGGGTGLLTPRVAPSAQGTLWGCGWRHPGNYEVDAVLLRELRELERQAAQELGQWSGGAVRAEVSGGGAGPLQVVLQGAAGAEWLPGGGSGEERG